jgi:hypothetical protein
MRRTTFALVAVVAAIGLAAAGCGGEEEATPTPDTVTGTLPETETTETETDTTETETDTTETETTETETTETGGGEGDAAAGKANLDDAQPSFDLAVDRVTNGQGAMPSFSGTLSEQEINDVATYVSTVAGG